MDTTQPAHTETKAEQAMSMLKEGKPIDQLFNRIMTGPEQLNFAAQICKGKADSAGMVQSHMLPDLEITCERKSFASIGTINVLKDIQKGTGDHQKDLYNRPSEPQRNMFPTAEATPKAAEPARPVLDAKTVEHNKQIADCVQQSGRNSVKSVELALCKAEH
jgi:hypothetical protein